MVFGTRVSRLRMKCVRQRCQEAPVRVERICVDEAGVRVGGDQLHAGQTSGDEAA